MSLLNSGEQGFAQWAVWKPFFPLCNKWGKSVTFIDMIYMSSLCSVILLYDILLNIESCLLRDHFLAPSHFLDEY